MTQKLKLAVFDCDGTLVDSQFSIIHGMVETARYHGRPQPGAIEVRRVIGLPLDVAMQRVFPGLGADDAKRYCETYIEVFQALRRDDAVIEPLFDGIAAALDRLEADGWLLGVATGKAMRGLAHTLANHRLDGRFVTLQTADRAMGKPHPDMLDRAMAETGVAAERVVMIGDTTFDMEMSVNAGTLALGVSWGYHDRDDLRATGAMALADHPSEVPERLNDLIDRAQKQPGKQERLS